MAAPAIEPTTRRRYTLPEFLELAEDLALAGSQEWFEIIGGELVAHASPRDPHMRAQMAVLALLLDAQRAGYGRAGADRTVVLDYRGLDRPVVDAFRPDALFVVTERLAILDHPDIPSVAGAPDLVLEVLSPSTARYDRPGGGKFRAYERAGVRFYWVVDTRERTVSTYERRNATFVETAVLHAGEELRCPLFSDLTLLVTDLFGS